MTSAPVKVANPADRTPGQALRLRPLRGRGARADQAKAARRSHRIQRVLYPFTLLAVLLGLWQYFTSRTEHRLLIPTFTEVAEAAIPTLTSGETWDAMWLSNQALFLGFGASLAVGIPAGLALGRFSWLERATNSYIDILLVLPMAAVIPLLVAQFGLGLFTRSLVVFLFAFVMILVNARAGIRSIDPALVEMARAYGGSERHIWQHVLLPGSVPALLAGSRIGLSRAITGMIVAELILIPVGIGNLINYYQGFLRAADLYALIALVLAESLVLVAIANQLERRLLSWKQ
jgi:ABC-type nitrate/sulfonate/bicarbonate transport system permease component